MVRRREKTNKSMQEHNKNKDLNSVPKKNIKERFTEMLELPKEIILDMPKLIMLGNGDLIIENYKGIIEYGEGVIRLNTTSGIIKVSGFNIYIKEITSESIMVFGNILSLEFQK